MGDSGVQVFKTVYVYLRKSSDWTLNTHHDRTSILSHRQLFYQVQSWILIRMKKILLLCVSDYSFHYHRIDLISPKKTCLYFQNNATKGKCCRHCQRKKVCLRNNWSLLSWSPICIYNPPNNFCGLSLDKIDPAIQNRTIVIRGHSPSDLISAFWFYFDGWKIKKQANIQANLLIGQGKSWVEMLACKSGSILAPQFQKLFFFFVMTNKQSG